MSVRSRLAGSAGALLGLAALAGGLALSVTLVTPASAVAEPAPAVWKSPVDPTVYTVDDDGTCHALTFATWQAMGEPVPQLFPTEYLAVPGFPYVYSSVSMCGRVQEDLLTFDQWRAVGAPTPRSTWQVQEIQYLRYLSSPAEIFVQPVGRPIVPYAVHMTPSMWHDAGSPTPTTEPERFIRPGWTAHVFTIDSFPGAPPNPSPVDFGLWVQSGAPTPDVVAGVPNGVFEQFSGAPDIFYVDGALVSFHVTYAEWAAAGYPRPVRR